MEKFSWQVQGGAIHEFGSATLEVSFECTVYAQKHQGKHLGPVGGGCVSSEGSLELTVE